MSVSWIPALSSVLQWWQNQTIEPKEMLSTYLRTAFTERGALGILEIYYDALGAEGEVTKCKGGTFVFWSCRGVLCHKLSSHRHWALLIDCMHCDLLQVQNIEIQEALSKKGNKVVWYYCLIKYWHDKMVYKFD